jgi:hypothetical protein
VQRKAETSKGASALGVRERAAEAITRRSAAPVRRLEEADDVAVRVDIDLLAARP